VTVLLKMRQVKMNCGTPKVFLAYNPNYMICCKWQSRSIWQYGNTTMTINKIYLTQTPYKSNNNSTTDTKEWIWILAHPSAKHLPPLCAFPDSHQCPPSTGSLSHCVFISFCYFLMARACDADRGERFRLIGGWAGKHPPLLVFALLWAQL